MNNGTLIAGAACLLGWFCLGLYALVLRGRLAHLADAHEVPGAPAPTVSVRDATPQDAEPPVSGG